eukprot:12870615-Ditylum_brightwellii.AAC.1
MKVATTNEAKSSGDWTTPTTMRMRQMGRDDASAGTKMTKEELNNKQIDTCVQMYTGDPRPPSSLVPPKMGCSH